MCTILSKKRIGTILLMFLLFQNVAHAQDPGDRAAKLKGTWWSGIHPDLLDDRMLSLKTLDGFGIGFSDGASLSALHYAPVPLLRSLSGGEEVVPEDDDDSILQQILKIKNAGYKVKAYINCENFIGTNQDQFLEFTESWKNWCDTDPEAQEFINSQSYHTQTEYPDRKYMFCYAEYVVKYYSLQYGQYFDAWIFDDGSSMEEHGDDATSGDVDSQRIYEAFANAARAGNDDIAVAFNNGRSTVNYDSYPFAHATRFDDFTFGHAFGGNNNHAEKVDGNQFNLNYQHVTRMTETDGYVHDGGNWDWDDKIVGNFHSKISTTAWKYGPDQAWEQDDFNEWNAEALLAGGMMTWDGSYNRGITTYYDWVYDMFKALDDYLYERGISINEEEDELSFEDISLTNEKGMLIYPNPVVSTTTIQGAANLTAYIYDMTGRELLTAEILTDSQELDFSSLTTGVYYVQIKGGQSISVIKIIKE